MSHGEKKLESEKELLHRQGLCIDCGAPVDDPTKYVRCKTCRRQRTKLQMQTIGMEGGTKKELQEQWRKNGLCTRCGKPVDVPGKYARCADCRRELRMVEVKRSTDKAERLRLAYEQMEQNRLEREAEKNAWEEQARATVSARLVSERETARLIDQMTWTPKRCEGCVYLEHVGAGKWYCPFFQCVRGRLC